MTKRIQLGPWVESQPRFWVRRCLDHDEAGEPIHRGIDVWVGPGGWRSTILTELHPRGRHRDSAW